MQAANLHGPQCFKRSLARRSPREGNHVSDNRPAVVIALCDSNGEMPIGDLAAKNGVEWENPSQGFKDVRRRLNNVKPKPKLLKIGWSLEKTGDSAKLQKKPVGARKVRKTPI